MILRRQVRCPQKFPKSRRKPILAGEFGNGQCKKSDSDFSPAPSRVWYYQVNSQIPEVQVSPARGAVMFPGTFPAPKKNRVTKPAGG